MRPMKMTGRLPSQMLSNLRKSRWWCWGCGRGAELVAQGAWALEVEKAKGRKEGEVQAKQSEGLDLVRQWWCIAML